MLPLFRHYLLLPSGNREQPSFTPNFRRENAEVTGLFPKLLHQSQNARSQGQKRYNLRRNDARFRQSAAPSDRRIIIHVSDVIEDFYIIMIDFSGARFQLGKKLSVSVPSLHLKEHDLIVLIGQNGSGKSSVARALCGELPLQEGTAPDFTSLHTELVSFEKQQQFFEDDYNMRNSDATTAKEEKGILTSDLLEGLDSKSVNEAIIAFGIARLMDRPIRTLSGGEGRKVLLVKALGARPDLLVLDTPFDALDVATRKSLLEIIAYVHKNYSVPVVLIVNRPDEIPQELTALGIISDLAISKIDSRENIEKDEEARSLLFCSALPAVELPKAPAKFALMPMRDGPIVDLKHINITYSRPIFTDLNFRVNPGEHWQITGPNGAGKSTLLSLITGDNPLVYANDVTVFGFKRGSGESIWEIKKYYGLVSGALHLDYRVSAPVINVILSGFYDSIGLYQHPGDAELEVARAWLRLIGLENKEHQSFKTLSFGQQRMLLIARALVKNPPLLILDEPLQGLDAYGRALVGGFITYVMEHGKTSVLFVSHHEEDAPQGITNRLTFVPRNDGNYDIVQEKVAAR